MAGCSGPSAKVGASVETGRPPNPPSRAGAERLAIYPETIASAWLTQHHQDRARRLLGEKARRQKLYKQFINEASKLYADALVHDEAELSALVSVTR